MAGELVQAKSIRSISVWFVVSQPLAFTSVAKYDHLPGVLFVGIKLVVPLATKLVAVESYQFAVSPGKTFTESDWFATPSQFVWLPSLVGGDAGKGLTKMVTLPV